MARIRTVKPTTFTHEELFDSEKATGLPLRLAYIGLWTQCDREGRFLWRPRQLKTDILPYDDEVDFARVLDALWSRGFLIKYEADGNTYGCIPSWSKHQVINNREKDSEIPSPTEETIVSIGEPDASATRAPRVSHACPTRPSLSPSHSLSSIGFQKEFEAEFWPAYPNKVGKPVALKAFVAARRRHSLKTILDGLKRYVEGRRPDQPWCNPSTWLNQDRCLDEPAPVATSPPRRASATTLAGQRLQEKLANGNGICGPDLRAERGADAPRQLAKPAARPGDVFDAAHDHVHGQAQIASAKGR